ncbi:TPA: class I SAM-dependent methyltransferase [Elizabethkingia anophelis]|uniref:class I SAM-dependent DNA methyltransferase n=1 Tax=Elizabethkingia anophelis TaxID=1117645 RepID=UPI000411E5C7|nr:class I SAM-dependent methyltransferase [Elizabethkingia anophelis]MCT3743198.1 class I SAM-dependent methyltransferase [Elizabethkingia anophelis]MDC8025822.1 class I SAM-dependent methyltransferase [Elizabethkingia anophelis]MDV3490683.1 class I SAM-dependent methyltransferase [Elizabethkingia anophelis]HAT3991197.1 class I SAM-dependent methyltransferase [Elizabethkingia anophelis]HAT3994872.1 class I SAM-dependent methyltransferase [Elizabethkingia anophelis]
MEDRLYQDIDLVQFYDYDNPWTESFDHFVRWSKEAHNILDLGCGTGTLTIELAKKDKRTIAIDIAEEMLQEASKKSDHIIWKQADIRTIKLDEKFDFILLSGHAFQVFLTDEDRLEVFSTIREHLNKNAIFVFDSRNPLGKEWLTWNEAESSRNFIHPLYGKIKAWNTCTGDADLLTYHTFYQAEASGQIWEASSRIAFPSKENIITLTEQAGLKVNMIYGDWQLNEFRENSEEMIFVGGLQTDKI